MITLSASLDDAAQHRVERAQRVAERRRAKAHAARLGHHQPDVAVDRCPQQIASERAGVADPAQAQRRRRAPDRKRSFERSGHFTPARREPAGEPVQIEAELEMFELASAVSERRNASRQIDREAQPGESQRQRGDLERTDLDRFVQFQTERAARHRDRSGAFLPSASARAAISSGAGAGSGGAVVVEDGARATSDQAPRL